jgi:hypothetical protein
MKKYILTESQVKKVIDHLISEQDAEDIKYQKKQQASYNNVWANPKVSEQMKKVKPGPNGKYAFSNKKLRELDQDFTNKLYVVKSGDTVDGLVNKLAGNSSYNIFASNDMLQNNPKNLRAGDVIAYSVAPSGN